MDWLKKFFQKIKGAPPTDLIFVESVTGVPGFGEPVEADECYVELYVESSRLTQARKFATPFDGVVYSFVSLARQGEPTSQLGAVSKPDKLAELDAASLDRVITVSKKMMGPVPWRGGTFGLELGLFSIKKGNLLTPVVDYVTKVSSAAGAGFVGAAKPFLPLITEGLDLLAGQRQDTAIEVAIDTDINLKETGIGAIIAAAKGSIDTAKLSVDPQDRKLLLDGHELQHGYCVFSIRRTAQKADFGEIPELKEKYAALQAAIRANKIAEAKEALTVFRLATIASPDLITSDARKLVGKAQEKLAEAFPAGGVSRDKAEHTEESLADIGLYDRV